MTLPITNVASVMPSDQDGVVNQLLAMDDTLVRKMVGDVFVAQMQNAALVKGTFFADVAPPLAAVPPAQVPFVAELAAALVALSLSQTSAYAGLLPRSMRAMPRTTSMPSSTLATATSGR